VARPGDGAGRRRCVPARVQHQPAASVLGHGLRRGPVQPSPRRGTAAAAAAVDPRHGRSCPAFRAAAGDRARPVGGVGHRPGQPRRRDRPDRARLREPDRLRPTVLARPRPGRHQHHPVGRHHSRAHHLQRRAAHDRPLTADRRSAAPAPPRRRPARRTGTGSRCRGGHGDRGRPAGQRHRPDRTGRPAKTPSATTSPDGGSPSASTAACSNSSPTAPCCAACPTPSPPPNRPASATPAPPAHHPYPQPTRSASNGGSAAGAPWSSPDSASTSASATPDRPSTSRRPTPRGGSTTAASSSPRFPARPSRRLRDSRSASPNRHDVRHCWLPRERDQIAPRPQRAASPKSPTRARNPMA
jgi:hypothetical protein